MRHSTLFTTLLYALLGMGILAALFPLAARWQTESRNRRVELVVDYSDAQALANTTRREIGDVLEQLKTAGVTTIAVTEDTPASLYANGVISTVRRDGDTTVVTFAPGFRGQQDRVEQMLAHKAPGLAVVGRGVTSLQVGAPWPQWNGIPIGLDSATVTEVRGSGLRVAPRLLNFTGVTPSAIEWELAQTQHQIGANGMGPLIFAGAAVLGNRALLGVTADALEAGRLTYGSVEFGKTLGDDELSRRAAARTVRVHSVGSDEMGTMEEPTAVERFLLATRDRNIRVCYVRLFLSGLTGQPDVLAANTAFIGKIVKGLDDAQFTLGAAHPYADDPTPARWQRVLMGLGAASGGLLLVRVFLGLRGRSMMLLTVLSLILGALLTGPIKGREVLALVCACAFPTLGLCAFTLPSARLNGTTGDALRRAFAAYARMTLSTLVGIVLIVGLLSGRLFLLKVDEFLGVKLVLIAPVLLTAAFYGLGLHTLVPNTPWPMRRERISGVLRGLAAQPLLVGQVVVGIVALAAFAVFVARSGNDPGVGVSGVELKLRSLLGKALFVRPRTKEFGLGHPALLVGLACAAAGRFPRAVLPLLIVGAVGQSSLLDTFCHLHTPLLISGLRGLIGWVLGAVIGTVIYIALARTGQRRAAV